MTNKIVWMLDILQEKFAKTKTINPKTLQTQNRIDIDLRINFLQDILERKKSIQQTMYYQFVADPDRKELPPMQAEKMCKQFLSLYDDIHINGICVPLNVAKLNSSHLDVSYFHNGERMWKKIPNETGYQLMNGAHRLAISLYMNYNSIPAKIFTPLSYPFQNHTDYVTIKEKQYQERMKN